LHKLIRKLKFVHYHQFLIESRTPLNIWLEAESHPTNGFARVGIVHLNQLPHTYQKTNRVWVEVEVEDYVRI
jgi:hypothetical protein